MHVHICVIGSNIIHLFSIEAKSHSATKPRTHALFIGIVEVFIKPNLINNKRRGTGYQRLPIARKVLSRIPKNVFGRFFSE